MNNMMKTVILYSLSFCLLILVSCEVNQTKETKLPDVDVDVKSGQLPRFDVDWASVDVGTKTKTISVPKLVVVTEEVEVEVPYIDVDLPNDGEKEELTLLVEAEVKNEMHNVKIKEVYATGNNLYVISELKKTGQKLNGNETVRVSDRVVLNAPDLNVKHYVIGKRPEGDHNRQFKYFSSMNTVKSKLDKAKAKRIYKTK